MHYGLHQAQKIRPRIHTLVKDDLLLTDLLPNTEPVESRALGVLKLDGNGGSHYLIGR